MKRASDLDLIIVGQGLAGSAVAMRALERAYRIAVFDRPADNRSSRVAAGLFNPITGKNLVKSWLADAAFPALHRFYPAIEKITNKRFFHPLPVYKTFNSIEEQNEWLGKTGDDPYGNYLLRFFPPGKFDQSINDPFGGFTLSQSGYLDTGAYLDAVAKFLEERHLYYPELFDYEKLDVKEDGVAYGSLRARRIIFCEGVRNASNPWMNIFPVNSLKGEFISVQCHWEKDVILNRGVYMVPGAGSSEWRVGATYNWNDHNPGITSWARNELSGKLDALIRMPYTITGQQWGVRPTTRDRRPIIGSHPRYPSMIIFNGLGTKGVSLAPYFSEVLFRWMENKGTIEKEADVSRFN
ncbi:MAG TPA: FAD-dependent oxidoreductase [Chryseosolibacter sp.]|nr:FAD-dependent oxidoreductase [Chryseosolibacter sp.]